MKVRYLILAAALIQGCAVNPPASKYMAIAPAGVDALRGKYVRIKALATPEFVQFTNGDQATMTVGMLFGAIGGGIGAAAAISHSKSRGHAVLKDNAIADPTEQLVERVKTIVTSKYGSTVGDTGYELAVATDYWALSKDDVIYFASVKLTDGDIQHPHLLASGECRFNTKNDKDKPTAEELLSNHAEKLKTVLAKAMDQCVQDFDEKVFL